MNTDRNIIELLQKMTVAEFCRLLADEQNIKNDSNTLIDKNILTAQEVLELYPIFSKFTLDKAIKTGGLPFYKQGHQRFFDKNAIDKWFEERNTNLNRKNINKYRL